MAGKLAEAFKRGWVRLAPASGLPRKQVAADLGVGLSTLNKWGKLHGDTGTVPQKEADLVTEIERLRRELRVVTEERETPEKATAFFAGQRRRGSRSLIGIAARCPGRVCAPRLTFQAGDRAPGGRARPAGGSARIWSFLRIAGSSGG